MWAQHLPEDDKNIWLWVGVALLVHLVLAAALNVTALNPFREPPPVKDIAVEIIPAPPAQSPPAQMPAPQTAPSDGSQYSSEPEKAAPSPAIHPAPSPQVAPNGMIAATQFYAATSLNDPRSRKAKARLGQLVSADRIIQLCNLEAMEQVRRQNPAFNPDSVIAYARSDVRLAGLGVEAEGGALHSKERWYEIRYKCHTSADLASVNAFEFAVGPEIPGNLWETYSLPAQIDMDD